VKNHRRILKKIICLCTAATRGCAWILVLFPIVVFGQPAHESLEVKPGKDRWKIKTSLMHAPKKRAITIADVIDLDDPISNYHKSEVDTRRIPTVVGDEYQEGNLVTLTGWIHLVALERDGTEHKDGDYHIQILDGPKWKSGCLIVEVPYPDFVNDPVLKEQCRKIRESIRVNMLDNKNPPVKGKRLRKAVHVRITGQLFFDASHLGDKPRGKMKMLSHTCWEIHPITSLDIIP
jgi:hypothetical protein